MCTSAQAQTNGLGPVNLPPDSFEGREFNDSAGCAFQRSTFGGEVVWLPRFGPDRNPVCGLDPTVFSAVQQADPTPPAPEVEAEAPTDQPASDTARAELPEQDAEQPRSRIEVLGGVATTARSMPAHLGKEPNLAGQAPRRKAAAPARRLPQADASGRHPSCPASSPYGQLVDTVLGRKMVRCVTSPSLFLEEYAMQSAAVAPQVTGGSGMRVQVGSFAVAANAQRLAARLTAQGLAASQHRQNGLTVVSVGPFGSRQAAQTALAQVRGMGFGDSFLRR